MPSVLVVEDQAYRDTLRRYLEVEGGWTVYAAGNAEEAKSILDARHGEIDGIVLDRRMPDPATGNLAHTGDSIIQWLFDKNLHHEICVIMLTGYPDIEIAQKALSMGGWHFLVKPVSPETIYKLLGPGIARKRSHRLQRWILSGVEIDRVIDRIQGIVQETLAPDHFSVYFFSGVTSRNLSKGENVDPNKRFVDHTLHVQRFLSVDTRAAARDWQAIHPETGTLMAVRVEAHENAEPVGVIVMESHEEGAFDPRWQETLSYLADLIGISLTIQRAFDEKRNAEQKSIELLNRELKHRMATSIGTMLQHVELIERDLAILSPGKKPAIVSVATVKRHLNNLVQVMGELGDVAKSSISKEEICDPGVVARQVVLEKLEETTITNAIRVVDPDIRVIADRKQLSYCLECIIQNAVEAVQERRAQPSSDAEFKTLMEEAGSHEDILVSIDTDNDHPTTVKVSVKDEGVGYDEEIRERLFNPLFTTKVNRLELGATRGIGLYSVKKMITSMKGSVEAVMPANGKGAEFVIRLRRAREARRHDETAPL